LSLAEKRSVFMDVSHFWCRQGREGSFWCILYSQGKKDAFSGHILKDPSKDLQTGRAFVVPRWHNRLYSPL